MRSWFYLPRSTAGKVLLIILWWPFAICLAPFVWPFYWMSHRRVRYYRR